ncbi:CD225/dispanin family protein [Marinitenerispora sediminis]|uniref:CD225/dispanin family protein n=1 Tax=Marinitenerispora sediminis TaxID=1931232 RepID=A0A368T0D6_9ACTN|nr:CD225/dispanin family protein [Marinitenerispora sediminis]RCV50730.1 hypothetical protein DEF28_17280 [Marinitenerispora sediminis]RCV52585.1 hypothetical protein DEF24_21785 [Marinitenerispora sediminis]RCV56328.1 hypothetical protein DEF23_12785 [Marinitenerispora sediminis]
MSYGPPSGPQNPGGYGPPSGGYGPPQPGGYPGGGAPAEQPKNWLWANILGIFGCTVIGIIGLIFALQVGSKWTIGDYAGAEDAASKAKIFGIISLIAFILQVVFWVIYIIFVVILAASSTATYSTY